MLDRAAILKDAQKYLAKGALDKAISELERLVKDNPDGNTFNMIGDVYLKKGSQKSAAEQYLKAAFFFRHEGFSQKAQALCKKVLNINPADTEALMVFGEICEEKGMLAEAIKYYLSVADILAKEGKKEKILDVYSKILSLSPANIPLRIKVADIYLKEGLKTDAAQEFVHIARIHDEKGDIQKAREFFQKTLDIHPLNKEATLGLTHIYEKTGEIQQAIEQMKDAMVLFPEDLDILFLCTDLAIISDDTSLGIKCLQQITEKEPQNIKARRMLGELYLKTDETALAWAQYLPILNEVLLDQNFEDAISFLNTFRSIEPIETGKRLVSLYKQLNEDDLAVTELISIGDVYAEKGLEDDAHSCYAEAEQINPLHAEVRKRLAPPEPELIVEGSPVPEIEIPEILTQESGIQEAVIEPEAPATPEIIKTEECAVSASVEPVVEKFEAPVDEKKARPKSVTIRAEKPFDEVITEADIFFRYGLLSEAQRLLEGLKQRFPENIDIHLRLKSVYADTHDREAVVSECLILNALYKRMGDEANAEQALKDAFELSPEDPRLAEQGFTPPIEQTAFTGPHPTDFGVAVSSKELDIDDYEEEIAEADFYASQGLVTEAIKILEKLQELFPENKDIHERLSAVGNADHGLEAGQLSGSVDMQHNFEIPEVGEELSEFELHETFGAGEESAVTGGIEQQEVVELPDKHEMFDIFEEPDTIAPVQKELHPLAEAASVAAESPNETEFETFNLSDDDLIEVQEMPEPALDNEVLEIFQEFKKGLDKELGDEDSETHYNLGIAYKEMGLVDDAIKEFQTSRTDPARFVQSSTMLGVCYMEKGLFTLAIDVLGTALKDMKEKDESYWAIAYELAEAYEKNQNLKEAINLYTGVYGWSAKFRSVSDKMSQLRAHAPLIVEKEKPKARKDRVSYL